MTIQENDPAEIEKDETEQLELEQVENLDVETEIESEDTPKAGLDELIEVLESRSEFFLTLAGFYFKPLTQEQIDSMAAADYSIYDVGESLLAEGFNDIWRFLRKRNTGTRQTLAVDFTSSFGGAEVWKGRSAMPVSSIFLGEHGLLYHDSRNEVFTTYKRQALKLKKGADLPEDHITFELEFLSVLSNRTIEALKEGDKKEAIANLRASQDFIRGHLLLWFKRLSELANLLITTRFYRGVMKITEGYLILDLQTIDDLIEEIESDVK
jgi:TorA maturation chaperone TorD